MKARETKPIVIYFGENERGLFVHETHAEIGSYGKHYMPWWESESMGWKLWFLDSVDMNGKTRPTLKANEENTLNISGHVSPKEYGNDILWVSATFGAGGICILDDPANPEKATRPRFPDEAKNLVGQRFIGTNLGRGPIFDARCAYDVICNGPQRSTIRVHTYNWNTTHGRYEVVQDYTAYAKKNYTTCHTVFTKFEHDGMDVNFGVGMRKIMSESSASNTDSQVISEGTKLDIWDINASLPKRKKHIIDWEGIAIARQGQPRREVSRHEGAGRQPPALLPRHRRQELRLHHVRRLEPRLPGQQLEGIQPVRQGKRRGLQRADADQDRPLEIREQK